MDAQSIKTIHGKLVAQKDDFGEYITYVFKNLDSDEPFERYIMCTRFPNWECPFLEIGDTGYVKYREVFGGVDEWYDKLNDELVKYNYTDIHFLDFVYDKEKTDDITL